MTPCSMKAIEFWPCPVASDDSGKGTASCADSALFGAARVC
jgi:hypothetical protein